MRNYCGPILVPIPYTIKPISYGGSYLTKNLYCRIEALNFDPTVVVSLNFTRMVNEPLDDIFVEIFYFDDSYKSQNIRDTSFYAEAFGISRFVFNYLSVQAKSKSPFELIFSLSNKSETNYIGIIIAVCVVIALCLICSGVFYKCSKVIMEKNRLKEEEERRRRLLLVEQIERERYQAVQLRESEEERKKIKLKNALKKLFETDLKPKKYKEDNNKFHTNCTICIEDFKPESVVVTLVCEHIFHFECLKDMLKKQKGEPKCPNCSSNLVPDGFLDVEEENLDEINRNRLNVTNNRTNLTINMNSINTSNNNLELRENRERNIVIQGNDNSSTINHNQLRNNFIENDSRSHTNNITNINSNSNQRSSILNPVNLNNLNQGNSNNSNTSNNNSHTGSLNLNSVSNSNQNNAVLNQQIQNNDRLNQERNQLNRGQQPREVSGFNSEAYRLNMDSINRNFH